MGNSHPVPLLMIIYWSDDSIQTVPEEVQAREMILWSKFEMLFHRISTILAIVRLQSHLRKKTVKRIEIPEARNIQET